MTGQGQLGPPFCIGVLSCAYLIVYRYVHQLMLSAKKHMLQLHAAMLATSTSKKRTSSAMYLLSSCSGIYLDHLKFP